VKPNIPAALLDKIPSLTYEQAEWRYRNGYLPEIEWRWFLFLWTWCAPRFSGPAGLAHDHAWKKLGKEAYEQRVNRVRDWAGLPPTYAYSRALHGGKAVAHG
jgi:hypothetical protein